MSVIKQLPKVLEATKQLEGHQRLIIEVLERIINVEEDRWECAAAIKIIYGCLTPHQFINVYYLPFFEKFIDQEIALDTDDLNCKVQLAEDLPELVFST